MKTLKFLAEKDLLKYAYKVPYMKKIIMKKLSKIDFSNWDFSNIKMTSSMLKNCDVFNFPISSWDVDDSTDFTNIFKKNIE